MAQPRQRRQRIQHLAAHPWNLPLPLPGLLPLQDPAANCNHLRPFPPPRPLSRASPRPPQPQPAVPPATTPLPQCFRKTARRIITASIQHYFQLLFALGRTAFERGGLAGRTGGEAGGVTSGGGGGIGEGDRAVSGRVWAVDGGVLAAEEGEGEQWPALRRFTGENQEKGGGDWGVGKNEEGRSKGTAIGVRRIPHFPPTLILYSNIHTIIPILPKSTKYQSLPATILTRQARFLLWRD
jgi:hypothetical protein